ncbi:MAG: hypothetical protein BZY80_02150 [SAR202 cluster bacterium Io17-Chloro-G2]|nr:MAG: hypothetical protein BZY80_02150 [SAR202 cluster bacterium Io17-Chloro-G2]
MIGVVIAVFLMSSVQHGVQAQQLPPHVFIGSANVDGNPVPDGTVIVAYIDGEGISKAVVEGGSFTLMVEQPQEQSFAGKIIQFTIGDRKAEESQEWEPGGAHELNLHAGGGASPGGSLQDAIECTVKVLGRMPMGPQDMSDQERMMVFQECPAVRANLADLTASTQPVTQPGDGFRTELRQIEQEIARVQRETPIKIQQELERLDQEISNLDRDLWDQLQIELNRLDQQRFDTEHQMQQELRSADFRRQAQIEVKYRRILDNLERERFQTERQTQVQIEQEVGRLSRNRDITERQLWDDQQQELNRLEQRRFELEDAMERERFAGEQRQRDEEDRRRFERERQMEEQRFKQQEELERQRIEQERQRFEQERKLEDERFRQQEQLDRDRLEQERQRLEQERRLDQERFNRESQIQTGQRRTSSILNDPSSPIRAPINLPTRGFFSNSSTGEISDLDKIMDPTSLAVLGIILTLLATSLSLVKGS